MPDGVDKHGDGYIDQGYWDMEMNDNDPTWEFNSSMALCVVALQERARATTSAAQALASTRKILPGRSVTRGALLVLHNEGITKIRG